MAKNIIILLLPFFILISCASKEEKLQNYKDYVQNISDTLKFEDGFNTIKVIGEKRSIFRSYFIEDDLVFINEDVSIGNRGTSANKYFFKDDILIHYSEHSIFMQPDSTGRKSKFQIKGSIYLDGKNVLEAERFRTEGMIDFSSEEIESVIDHSKLLQELAKKNRPRKVE